MCLHQYFGFGKHHGLNRDLVERASLGDGDAKGFGDRSGMIHRTGFGGMSGMIHKGFGGMSEMSHRKVLALCFVLLINNKIKDNNGYK